MNTSTPSSHAYQTVFERLKKLANRIGKPIVEKALYLYFALQNPDTPTWAKRVIYGALAYLVMPMDAIPDLLPAIGFTDDLSVIAAAITTVSFYITDDVKKQAKEKLAKWFKEDNVVITD